MELKGESRIAASREAVWAALNDPEILSRCIDGVETLTRVDGEATRFEGKMNARVGPVRATFAGAVTVTEPDPPHRYVLVGEGKGGVAGFAKGSAEVVLTQDGADTLLNYNVTSSVGGKLAQLGSRLIEGTAKGYATTFFERFKAEVEAPVAAAPSIAAVEELAPTATVGAGVSPLVWAGVVIAAVGAFLVWQLV